MRHTFPLPALSVLLSGASCSTDSVSPPSDTDRRGASVWSVDLVRTLPGSQADYVRSIEDNWAGARELARERGAVISYQAFVAQTDTAGGWDVMLMTEYADSTAWANREEVFQAIFSSPEFVEVEPARPSAEMRTFAAGGVTMQQFVSAP